MNRVVVVGDVLLDRDLDGRAERLCPDAPVPVVDDPTTTSRPGGAGLAASLAAGDGRPVSLVTAMAHDAAGAELRGLLRAAGVEVVALPLDGTTARKVRIRAAGRSLLRLDYGETNGTVGRWTEAAASALAGARAVLVSDYGRGVTHEPTVRAAVAEAARSTPVVWDPHPRGAEPPPAMRLVTPNAAEARTFTDGDEADDLRAVTARARTLVRRWQAAGVSVTLGARGALLVSADGTPLAVPAAVAPGPVDPCGAGDRYASRVAGALADGALLSDAVVEAVGAASAFVAAGGAAAFRPPPAPMTDEPRRDAMAVVRSCRQRGGTVVATGGCFDLLHAGHVQTLAAARQLGDCLVVCLNSDASVRRLKGPGRPLVPEQDRAAVLYGLEGVDAVAIFDEDTPEAILDRLRPDIWAKGADYAVADLPEATLVQSWGGQAVVLPYLAGRSTTTLIKEVLDHER